ncbi:hypothetical protein ACFQV2_09915 [Actinokineospora soli]|uniref:TFIIB zinc-binding n=1 Tax=Actinokineospora soli TaxID=1048753 RepID=A0ABW2TJY1_9PSEU
MERRFTDRDDDCMQHLHATGVQVRCPRCGGRAVASWSRVTCGGCGYALADRSPSWPSTSTCTRTAAAAGAGCGLSSGDVAGGVLPHGLPVRCPSCRAVTRLPAMALWRGDGGVPRFRGLELWLQIPFRGHVLWAYHEEHLDFLERYVAAAVRERQPNRNSSVASRLPAWIKSAKNRDDILRALARMRATLGA